MSKRKKRHNRSHTPKPKKVSIRVLLIAGSLLLFAVAGHHMLTSHQTVDIWIGECRIKAEIADTAESHAKGLSGRKHLKADHGMLFVFEYLRRQSFWMKDTSLPLSIAFISPDGTIRQIEQMTPFDLSMVTSHSPAQYALEVNQGFFQENGVTVGMHVDLSNVTKR